MQRYEVSDEASDAGWWAADDSVQPEVAFNSDSAVTPSRFTAVMDSLFDSVITRIFQEPSRAFGQSEPSEAFTRPFPGLMGQDDSTYGPEQGGDWQSWEEAPTVRSTPSSTDLFRQLSLARFVTPTRTRCYRIYMVRPAQLLCARRLHPCA